MAGGFRAVGFQPRQCNISVGQPQHEVRRFRYVSNFCTKSSLDLVRKAAPGVIRVATSFIPVVGSEVGNVLGSIAEQKLAGYQQAQQSVVEFKSALEKLADTLWKFSEKSLWSFS